MKKLFYFVLIASIALACSEGLESPNSQTVRIDELVFGRFYGMCFGESCVEIYLVNDEELLEDTTDNYLFREIFEQDQYLRMSAEKHSIALELLEEVPIQLTQQSNNVYGCPDCHDQGGLHLKIIENGEERNFRFDLENSENPDYLRPYLRKVNQTVDQLAQ